MPTSIDFILATSYIKTGSSGKSNVHYDVREQIAGKHVLLIDDIIDTGVSLDAIREGILAQHPASLKLCVLLDKQSAGLSMSRLIMSGSAFRTSLSSAMDSTTKTITGTCRISLFSPKNSSCTVSLKEGDVRTHG